MWWQKLLDCISSVWSQYDEMEDDTLGAVVVVPERVAGVVPACGCAVPDARARATRASPPPPPATSGLGLAGGLVGTSHGCPSGRRAASVCHPGAGGLHAAVGLCRLGRRQRADELPRDNARRVAGALLRVTAGAPGRLAERQSARRHVPYGSDGAHSHRGWRRRSPSHVTRHHAPGTRPQHTPGTFNGLCVVSMCLCVCRGLI